MITEDESHLDIKQKCNELMRKIIIHGGVIDVADKLEIRVGEKSIKCLCDDVWRKICLYDE